MTSTVDDVYGRSVRPHTRPGPSKGCSKVLPASITWLIEMLAVLASPAVLFWILRLRAMAPVQQQDPSMHTAFIFDPGDLASRFGNALSAEMIGDSARVGFVVPARAIYLLFGAVPGFFVYRYLLALVAIVPAYLLLRRLYGLWAGWVGVVVLMSSAVLVGTWGSDYSSSAALSYLIGGQAALALSLERRRRGIPWLLGAGVLFTMSVWTNGICALIILPAVAAYLVCRLVRDRRMLGWDILLLAAGAALTTVLLGIFSELLFRRWDFIQVSVRTSRTLATPEQIKLFHSVSWAWAPFDLYLLVPPAIAVAYFIVFSRRGMRSSVLSVGIAGTLQMLVFGYLQFFGSLWVLEQPLFSCLLWGGTNLMLALLVSEILKGWAGSGNPGRSATARGYWTSSSLLRAAGMAIPALVVLAVPLAYEATPGTPALVWSPWGYVLGLVIVAAVVCYRLAARPGNILKWRVAGRTIPQHGRSLRRDGLSRPFAAGIAAIIVGATLILTVAPEVPHLPPPNTGRYNPTAEYSSVLGGDSSRYLEEYRVESKLPSFVGPPSYGREQVWMWTDPDELFALLGPFGVLGGSTFLLSGTYPSLDATDRYQINLYRPGQIVLMGLSAQGFGQALAALSPYGPRLVRKAVLGNSLYPLHVWLIDLGKFAAPAKV